MFKDLYAVARHTALHLIITPAGEQLKVIVTPKPSGDAANNAALSKPFSATGTPEELDREFPGALAQYAGAVNDLRASINLPLDAFEDAKKKAVAKEDKKAEKKRQEEEEAKRRSDGAKKAAETRAAKAEEERKTKEAKAKAKADAKEAKKAAKAGVGIQLPGAAPATAAAASSTDESSHRTDLPGKEACIRDYQQMKLKHSDKLTRRLFIKKGETGRRYEKLWKNWDKFIKDATAQQPLPLEPKAAPQASSNLAADRREGGPDTAVTGSEGAKPEKSGPAGAASKDLAWPFPTHKKAEATTDAEAAHLPDESGAAASAPSSATAKQADPLAVLETTSRTLLGTYAEPAVVGSTILLESRPFLVDHVVPGVEIHAHRVHDPYWAIFDDTGKTIARTGEIYAAGDTVDLGRANVLRAPDYTADDELVVHEVHEHDRAYTVKLKRPKFIVADEATGEIVAEYKWGPAIGERLTPPGRDNPYRVVSIDGQRAEARRLLQVKKAILSDTGEKLGETDEVYEITDQVAELTDKEWRVIREEENAYIVKAAKPRIKGPLAATATTE